MGLFDNLIKKANAALESKTEEINKKVEDFQKKITEPIDFSMQQKPESNKQSRVSMQEKNKQNRIQQQIINRFYSDYPETPYIAADRESSWIERAELFPEVVLVKRQMMQRNADNLLPGHVYMLNWLKRYAGKKAPIHFEYKYGIDFEKEKEFLFSNGFLNELSKPTEKGAAAIKTYADVFENHAKLKSEMIHEEAIKATLSQRDSLRRNGFNEYEVIVNKDCCEICAKLKRKHIPVAALKIGVNAPPMHEGCSCSICAYSDRAEYEAWLDSISKRNRRK